MSDEETFQQKVAAASPHLRGFATLSWSDLAGPHTAKITGRALVGSAERADVVLADPAVSRLHAEIVLGDDGLWVRDLGSRNGTWVGGVLVRHARVGAGQGLLLGGTTIEAHYHDVKLPEDAWKEDHFGPLIGPSAAMRVLFMRLSRIAATESFVLIHGESGTGKELVARAIHESSPRAGRPFVVVDCGALPEALLDSELFGHAKGAFTGATSARDGAIESADGGSVFLDEIGELPLAVQPKLLRVLESRTVRRIGETAHRKVDVRFISATHRDLLTMVNQGQFREDLYFRLAVIPVIVPPLRDRMEDLPALVRSFAPSGWRLGPEAMRELGKQPWRGNVRELRNFVERAVALGPESALAMLTGSVDLPLPPPSVPEGGDADAVDLREPFTNFRERWRDRGDREYLRKLLAAHGNNIAAAAKAAGVNRTYIYKMTRRLGL